MKSIAIFAISVMASAIIIFSCKNRTSAPVTKTEDKTETAKETPKGKYAIKSGIIEFKTQVMGMEVKQLLTFDDYGKKDAQEMVMEMMGTSIHSVTLHKDGFVYTLDLVKKTGTKSPFYQGSSSEIDFENLSEEMVRDMNLKKEGTEEFLGRTCQKMSIDYKKMQMKGDFLVYKGVALKTDVEMGTLKMKLEAEKFIENPEIPADKFEIPADIIISEK
jgi:hypothetical protein